MVHQFPAGWWCPAIMLALWWIQPWCMYGALSIQAGRNAGFYTRGMGALTAVLLSLITAYVAISWHETSSPGPPAPRFVLALFYLPAGTQILRHVHLASVGPAQFCQTFGLVDNQNNKKKSLLSFRRVKIFMWSTGTVFFVSSQHHPNKTTTHSHKKDDDDDKETAPASPSIVSRATSPPWNTVLQTSLLNVFVMIILCLAVLKFEWYQPPRNIWQHGFQLVVRILIMGTSMALFRLFLEVPVRFALRHDPTVQFILPVYQEPLQAKSPRDFWHRWSTSVGYHLRGAFYDTTKTTSRRPTSQHPNNKDEGRLLGVITLSSPIVRALVPFGVNGVLHIYWWSLAMRGQVDYSYVTLLGIFPIASFVLQDMIVRGGWGTIAATTLPPPRPKPSLLWQAIILRLILWIGFGCVAETMQIASGAPLSLQAICRSNLLLPKLVPPST